MTGKSKIDFRNLFQLAPVRDGAVNTRGNTGYLNVVEPPLCRDNVRKYFFSQRCPRVWNALPDTMKKASTVNGFKAAYDDYQRR